MKMGNGKIVWTETLRSFAGKKYEDGNYSEARKTFNKIIEMDQLDAEAYSELSWCYLRDNTVSYNDRKNELGHQRSLGHARLCIDLKTDQLSRSPIVVAKVRAAHAAAAKRVMGSQRESADFLVNIW